jgi:DNA-binding NarL/FixJ family response regulator
VERIRVLIADDHEEILDYICALLEPEFAVVGAVGDGDALISAADAFKPDVIITDISMPRLSGIEAARRIIQNDPASRIILMTAHSESALVEQGLSAGALGYVLKLNAGDELRQAILSALEEKRFISPGLQMIRPPAEISASQPRNFIGQYQ